MNTPDEIRMAFDPFGFQHDLARLEAASAALTMALELPAATWEPHDWSDFE